MVLELHVWGPAFGLASIEPECIATIAYCRRVIPEGQWALVAAHNPTVGTTGTGTCYHDKATIDSRISEILPILFDDGVATASGFEDIVAYLRNYPTVTNDLDAGLSSAQQIDRTA
jgi:hypothetical protein